MATKNLAPNIVDKIQVYEAIVYIGKPNYVPQYFGTN